MGNVRFKNICPKCGKEFIVECTQSEFNRGKYKKFCSRQCANARVHSVQTKNKIANSLTNYYAHNEHHQPLLKTYYCKECGKPFTIKDSRDITGRQYCSTNCKTIWLKNNVKWGGHRVGSGHGKSGWYKGVYCSSTWELAFLVYCLDHNIHIERCKDIRQYVYNGKIYKYYPDFVTDDGIIEIKGYSTKQWEAKRKYNPDIIVLYRDDMKRYLSYVHDKYTNNLVELYDNSKPIIKTSTVWVHKDKNNKLIKTELLNEYLENGWIRGRNIKNRDRH